MNRYKDLTNKRFGRLVAIKIDHFEETPGSKRTYWFCKCDCGNSIVVRSDSLTSGNTKSCGCFNIDSHKRNSIKKHKLYRVYWGMKQRCYCEEDRAYKWYGAKSVKICDEWLNSYESFYNWCMNNGYKEGLTIDRINCNGNYEPSNCRFITMQEQLNNTNRNRIFTYNGESLNIVQWSRKLGISQNTLYARLITYHWETEKALTKPVEIRRRK